MAKANGRDPERHAQGWDRARSPRSRVARRASRIARRSPPPCAPSSAPVPALFSPGVVSPCRKVVGDEIREAKRDAGLRHVRRPPIRTRVAAANGAAAPAAAAAEDAAAATTTAPPLLPPSPPPPSPPPCRRSHRAPINLPMAMAARQARKGDGRGPRVAQHARSGSRSRRRRRRAAAAGWSEGGGRSGGAAWRRGRRGGAGWGGGCCCCCEGRRRRRWMGGRWR